MRFTAAESAFCAAATLQIKTIRAAANRFTAHSPTVPDSHRQSSEPSEKLDARGSELVSAQRLVNFLIRSASAGHFAASSA